MFFLIKLIRICKNKSDVFCGNSGQNTRSVTKAYKLHAHDCRQLACAEDKK